MKTILAIFAHPDDAEFMCAGTLFLLRKAGCSIHIASMTPGDKGSAVFSREEISTVRRGEAQESAGIIEGKYHCLEFEDVYLIYERESVNRTTALIRKVRPDIVFTASPEDYMADHEMTGRIVATACFCAGIKNMEVKEPPFEPVPALYYSDPMEGKDILGHTVTPSIYVDISTAMEVKARMLSSHKSQRDWLLAHHKMDEYILSMKRFSRERGGEINTEFAEGFRQHLGHGYPQANILRELLGDLIYEKRNQH